MKLNHDHVTMTASGHPSLHHLRRHTALFDEEMFQWLETERKRRQCSMAMLIRTLVALGRELEQTPWWVPEL